MDKWNSRSTIKNRGWEFKAESKDKVNNLEEYNKVVIGFFYGKERLQL